MGTNNFPQEAQWVFLEDNKWVCWGCGANHANCLHHIFKRGNKHSTAEQSFLNVAPMNNFDCHIPRHSYWTSMKGKEELLKKTVDHLAGIGYELKEVDLLFLTKYQEQINKMKI